MTADSRHRGQTLPVLGPEDAGIWITRMGDAHSLPTVDDPHMGVRQPAAVPHGPVVQASALAKEYPSGEDRLTVLGGIDLSVDHGDFVALRGPSGSGKTTLLNLIAGLDVPTSGRWPC